MVLREVTARLVAGVICVITLGAAECERPTVAGCSLGMTLEQVKRLVPNASVTAAPDGTKMLKGSVPQPYQGMKLGPNLMKVMFDRAGQVVEVWLSAETELDEQKVLKVAEAVWGTAESIHHFDFSNSYTMNASWSSRCGATPLLNVKVTGPPWKSAVHLGLQGG